MGKMRAIISADVVSSTTLTRQGLASLYDAIHDKFDLLERYLADKISCWLTVGK